MRQKSFGASQTLGTMVPTDPKSCDPSAGSILQLLLQPKDQLAVNGKIKFLLSDELFCLEKRQAKIRHTGALQADRLSKKYLDKALEKGTALSHNPQTSNLKHLVVIEQNALSQAEMKFCLGKEKKKKSKPFPVSSSWMLCFS